MVGPGSREHVSPSLLFSLTAYVMRVFVSFLFLLALTLSACDTQSPMESAMSPAANIQTDCYDYTFDNQRNIVDGYGSSYTNLNVDEVIDANLSGLDCDASSPTNLIVNAESVASLINSDPNMIYKSVKIEIYHDGVLVDSDFSGAVYGATSASADEGASISYENGDSVKVKFIYEVEDGNNFYAASNNIKTKTVVLF